MNLQRKAYIYALLATLLWSTIGSAFKITLRYISFADLLLFAAFTSVIFFLILMVFTGKIVLLKQLKAKDYLMSAMLGALNPFLYYLVLLKAYELLLAQEAGTLNYIWPVVLVLLSIPLLKQNIGWLSILAIIISFAGTIIIGTRGQLHDMRFTNTHGVLLALASAVFWALFWIFNVKDKKDEVVKLFLNFCFGSLFILIYVIFTTGLKIPGFEGLTGAVYAGLVEMGITYILWLKALKLSATTAKVSNLVYLSPFLSLIIIRFIVGEEIFLTTIAGLILIVGGIILQQFAESTGKQMVGRLNK
ncbi:MAG TPA: DMT family transporter [Bacteroidales bacterium]|nr:DMT family transporter [Bacteroidales bacterium]